MLFVESKARTVFLRSSCTNRRLQKPPRATADSGSAKGGSGPAKRSGLSGLPFRDARAIARTLNVESREDWDDYRGRGAYALPSDPQVI